MAYSPLGDSSSTTTAQAPDKFAAAKQAAEKIGEMAAYQLIQQHQNGQLPKFLTQSSPGIPAPQVMEPTAGVGARPEAGGGYTNYGQRVSADKTTMLNMVHQGVTAAITQHKQQEVRKATTEYQVLFNAMNALKVGQDVDHNKAIVEDFFNDKAKVKRLEKVMGFDAFDIKKEQQKQQDPHYQAMQAAIKNAQTVTVPTMNANGSMQPSEPNRAPVNNEPSWMANLPENAKALMKQIPSMPPPTELERQAMMIKAGILPTADKKYEADMGFAKGALTDFASVQNKILDSSSAEAVESMRADALTLSKKMDIDSAKYVADLNYKSQSLDRAIKAQELALRTSEHGLNEQKTLLDMQSKRMELQQEKVMRLSKVFGDKDPDKVPELRNAIQAYYDAEKSYDYSLGDYKEKAKSRGVNVSDYPTKDADYKGLLDAIKAKNGGRSTMNPAPANTGQIVPIQSVSDSDMGQGK